MISNSFRGIISNLHRCKLLFLLNRCRIEITKNSQCKTTIERVGYAKLTTEIILRTLINLLKKSIILTAKITISLEGLYNM